MIISELLASQNMSQYSLSKKSGVSQAAISDICSGKTALCKCASGTLYRIAKVLGVTVETLLEAEIEREKNTDFRASFETFKSSVCHRVKDMGDLDFIVATLQSDQIRVFYERGWYPESLYLLAMVDYLSRVNELPIYKNYNDIRCQRLSQPVYSAGVLLQSAVLHTDKYKKDAEMNAIPEFIRFNIIESEVRDVI